MRTTAAAEGGCAKSIRSAACRLAGVALRRNAASGISAVSMGLENGQLRRRVSATFDTYSKWWS